MLKIDLLTSAICFVLLQFVSCAVPSLLPSRAPTTAAPSAVASSISYPGTSDTWVSGITASTLDNLGIISCVVGGKSVGSGSEQRTAEICPYTSGPYTQSQRSFIAAINDQSMTKMVLFTLSILSNALYIRTDGTGYYSGSSFDCTAINTAWSGKITQIVATSSTSLDYNIHSLVLGSLESYSLSYPPKTDTAIAGTFVTSLNNVAILSSQISGNSVGTSGGSIITAVACPRTAGTYTSTTRSYIMAITDRTDTKMVLVTLSIQSGVLYIKGDLAGYKSLVTGCANINTAWESRSSQTLALSQYVTGYGIHSIVLGITEIAPSMIPSAVPSMIPSVMPSIAPSVIPSMTPSVVPSVTPSVIPSAMPSVIPSIAPSVVPSMTPSVVPTTITPSVVPSKAPSIVPSKAPSVTPSKMPSVIPTTITPSAVPSVTPSVIPSTMPCVIPSIAPSVIPSVAPSVMPSTTPSVAPSTLPSVTPSIPPSLAPSGVDIAMNVNSPVVFSVQTRNQFAFAAINSIGGVVTWGDVVSGGDSSTVAHLLVNVKQIVQSVGAFAALKKDGTVVIWGLRTNIANCALLRSGVNVTTLIANKGAFAGITRTGGVVTCGRKVYGGSLQQNGYSVAQYLTSKVVSLVGTDGAFAALKSDGTVYAWGNKFAGGGVSTLTMSSLENVVQIAASQSAFAALKLDGSVVTWGASGTGGDMSSVANKLASNVQYLLAYKSGFMAYSSVYGVVAWSDYGSLTETVTGNVTTMAYTDVAASILKEDGTVVSWGDADFGGSAPSIISSVQNTTHVGNVCFRSSGPSSVTHRQFYIWSNVHNITKIVLVDLKIEGTSLYVVAGGAGYWRGNSITCEDVNTAWNNGVNAQHLAMSHDQIGYGVSSLSFHGVTSTPTLAPTLLPTAPTQAPSSSSVLMTDWVRSTATLVTGLYVVSLDDILFTTSIIGGQQVNGRQKPGHTCPHNSYTLTSTLRNYLFWGSDGDTTKMVHVKAEIISNQLWLTAINTGYKYTYKTEATTTCDIVNTAWSAPDQLGTGFATCSTCTGYGMYNIQITTMTKMPSWSPTLFPTAEPTPTQAPVLTPAQFNSFVSLTPQVIPGLSTITSLDQIVINEAVMGGAYMSVTPVHVYSNGGAFAALTGNGGVNTWGETDSGGYYEHPSLSQGVVDIVSTRRAFAALKSDGSVVVWGNKLYGGYVNSTIAAYLTSDVKLICANEVAFTASKTDGTMITWGNKKSIGSGSVMVDADVRDSAIVSC